MNESPLHELEFAFLDVETTGLWLCGWPDTQEGTVSYVTSTGQQIEIATDAIHRIVEVAAVRVDFEGRETGHFSTLVNPGRRIPAEARDVHGIGDTDVAGAPGPIEAISALNEFLRSADVTFAYNSPFDLRFIVHEHTIRGLPPPPLDVLDVARIATALGRERLPLDDLASELGVRSEISHRALPDARTTSRVLLELLYSTPAPPRTLADLFALHSHRSRVYDVARATASAKATYGRWLEDPRRRAVRAFRGNVCVTGTVPGVLRKDVKSRIAAVGYSYQAEVHPYSEFVVEGTARAAVRKLAAAREMGIPIVPAEDFVEWLRARERARDRG